MLRSMIQLLVDQPLLLLFAVLAAGFALGRFKLAGISLGVAAVLFVGLGAGALDPRLQLPEIVQRFGLVLFVYTVGVASGPGFIASFRRRGLRDAFFTIGLLTLAAIGSLAVHVFLGVSGPRAAGLFAGSLTNTPSLAAVIERLRVLVPNDPTVLAEPVVAYSISYPMGVFGVILALAVARRFWKKELEKPEGGTALEVRSIHVTNADACTVSVEGLVKRRGWKVLFARRRRGEDVAIINGDEPLAVGDLVTVVGAMAELQKVIDAVGELAEERLELDRTDLDFRRIFVSEPAVAERPLSELKTLQRFGAVVTRVRRGDVDLLPDGGTILELGDRVRVLGPRSRMSEVARFFGDSYRALAEVDVLSFGLGIAAGLVLGMIPVPLPNGGTFSLGVAGGPLVAGLILGALGRTGVVVWQLPYSANLTLRQIGLVLFLAGVGTRSGWVFAQTFAQAGSLTLFLAGTGITLLTTILGLLIGRKFLKVRPSVLFGMVAGVQTQPAVLAFANENAVDDGPNVGYSAVYPFATIAKIILAQLLVEAFR
jgi:putative transport protein